VAKKLLVLCRHRRRSPWVGALLAGLVAGAITLVVGGDGSVGPAPPPAPAADPCAEAADRLAGALADPSGSDPGAPLGPIGSWPEELPWGSISEQEVASATQLATDAAGASPGEPPVSGLDEETVRAVERWCPPG
jgi:hypothetical protein